MFAKRIAAIIAAFAISLSFGHPVANAETTPRLADIIINTPNLPAVTDGSLWAGMVYLDVDSVEHYYGKKIVRQSDDEYLVVVSMGMELQRQYNGRYSATDSVQKFFVHNDPEVNQALVEEARTLACAQEGKCTFRLFLATPQGLFEVVEGQEPANI